LLGRSSSILDLIPYRASVDLIETHQHHVELWISRRLGIIHTQASDPPVQRRRQPRSQSQRHRRWCRMELCRSFHRLPLEPWCWKLKCNGYSTVWSSVVCSKAVLAIRHASPITTITSQISILRRHGGRPLRMVAVHGRYSLVGIPHL
jgi:hypothetical protein